MRKIKWILSVCFLISICGLLSIADEYSPGRIDNSTKKAIKAFLRNDKFVKFELIKNPQYRVPYELCPQGNKIFVKHTLKVPKTKKYMPVKLYFNNKGEFIYGESVVKTTLYRKRKMADLKKVLRGRLVSYNIIAKKFDFDLFWKNVCKRFSMDKAVEFNFTLVKQEAWVGKYGKPRKKKESILIIMNIWGLDNPLGIRYDFPFTHKNKIRAFFDLNGKFLGGDNLL